ncbi:MAG TPA: isocitrate lyase/phosphoenolpyruvate mutase family protein [Burkholderiales bacterium]|jgi:carboxyvinyl-carboxyphosphonate phosphorylmutase|nr:isocitrate lyase/phosphoenolpyruvate mutase family protein [Burkholderiales bacterium]
MSRTDQRKRLRAILSGKQCLSPATVYDALSARIAESVGYEIGIFSGSVSASTTLAAPDLVLQTLTEFADQVRRIMRGGQLSLLVDADHGYGNALNVMRTVQELEHAGVSALTVEDLALPAPFGQPEDTYALVSIDEMLGKLRAALQARQDPSLVIAGRIAALKAEGVASSVARAKAYATTGIDAIFITGLEKLSDFEAIRAAIDLPIIVGTAPAVRREDLAARGVRILLQGHSAVAAAAKALRDTYTHLHNGGAPADLKSKIASAEEMNRWLGGERYRKWQREYLH